MRYDDIKSRNEQDFKRLTGVTRATFDAMLAVVRRALRDFGRPPALSREDQRLLTLMYWREYRTQFHIASTDGISESAVCRTSTTIEDALVKSGAFRLPGKKALQPSETVIAVVLVDVSEQPIARPKKSHAGMPAASSNATRSKHTGW